MSEPLRPPDDVPRWARKLLWAVLVAAAVYTVSRALRLGVDYYDGFVYLYNASRLAGDPVGGAIDDSRPWLLSVLQAPVVALARLGGPANPWLLRAPHLLDATLSLGSVCAVAWLLRPRFGATLALLGAVLFVSGRCFVHYGANVMTDLAVTGLCALTLALHLRAVHARRLGGFALAGLAFGCAISMKFTAPMFVVTILVTEAASLVELERASDGGRRLRFRLDPWRRLGLVVEGGATVVTFAAVELLVFVRLYGARAWPSFQAAFAAALKLRETHYAGEEWQDNLHMLVTIVSAPMLILAALGLVAALARPRRDDVPFAAWLVGVGASLMFAIGHSEARYLLPLVPPLIYFAVRAAEVFLAPRASRIVTAARRGAVGLLVVGSLLNGLFQVRDDADPIFGRDLHGRAARALAARRPGGPPFVVGNWHTLSPAMAGPVPADEFWNTFHASPFVVAYELGQAVTPLPGNGRPFDLWPTLVERGADGDRALRFNDVFFMTLGFPKGRRDQALEVWTFHRRDFVPVVAGPGEAGDERRFTEQPRPGAPADPEVTVRTREGQVSFAGVPPGGPWWIFTRTGTNPWVHGGVSTAGQETTTLDPSGTAGADHITLLRVDVERFE